LEKRIVIVGGGIVGLATAYRLQQSAPDTQITILEQEPAVAAHQSSHNSGVLHCGLYYRPGSHRARLAVSGIRQMIAFCRDHSIPHEVCGKVVVATEQEEIPRLHDLFERGRQNGLQGLRLLNPEQLKEIEPHAAGLAAILVPEEGIADFPRVCTTLAQLIQKNGGEITTSARVTSLERRGAQWRIKHTAGELSADLLITCAGLYSDRVAALTGRKRDVRIIPFRGEYFIIRPERQFLVRNLIYPVPDPRLPFLGVHFTRRIGGGIEAGPNAVLALSRIGYSKGIINPRDALDAVLFS
jgi:L-2-hydroxyglutarate oxidase